jgi:hypothetical protein
VRNIQKRIFSVYGSATVERSSVGHWAKRVTASGTGTAELYDLPRSGRPVAVVNPEMLQCADTIVCEDLRVPTDFKLGRFS